MKKIHIILIIVIIVALFAAADYYLNNLDGRVALNAIKDATVADDTTSDNENTGFIDSIFKLNQDVLDYKVISQVQTSQVFEKIDLSNIKNIKIYRNRLEKSSISATAVPNGEVGESANNSDDTQANTSIYLYEIHGPSNQGSLTYLNVKLQFISQINATSEILNETGELGNNSFFFNDLNYENIAFLLVQIGDKLFAFQYNKQNSEIYDDVRAIVADLMSDSESKTTSNI